MRCSIFSAQQTASSIAAIVAGTRAYGGYRASFLAARIDAAIRITRLRPSSISAVYIFALYSPTMLQ
jgi:hypothetical protein